MMKLTNDLLTQFVKVTNNERADIKEMTLYGVVAIQGSDMYVKLDGSDVLTPVETMTAVKEGERVSVVIKNHHALITGNLSVPSARNDDMLETKGKLTEFETVVADKVSTSDLDAQIGRIDQLFTENIKVTGKLNAGEAAISKLETDTITIKENLTANNADITNLKASKLDASVADITFATIDKLNATNAVLNNLESTYGDFVELTTDNFTSTNATIEKLDTKFAKIDLANIENGIITSAMIGAGVIGNAHIADGSITDAKIVNLTANKLTAGTIDAAQIDVINLNCSNLTVGSINGAQIGSGAIDWSKLNTDVSTSIDTANTNASQALADAENAKNTADSKNKNYYSSVQPAGNNYHIGDTWFNLSDQTIHTWNGNIWELCSLGENSIADAAITNAKIFALDAGKITTGYLDANRLKASSITSEKIDVNAILGKHIHGETITGDKLAMQTITADNISSGAIQAKHLNANTILSDHIASGAVTADKIASDAIKSKNYEKGVSGAFLNLKDGTFDSRYLNWDENGVITATKGTIGGVTIDLNCLTASEKYVNNVTKSFHIWSTGLINLESTGSGIDFSLNLDAAGLTISSQESFSGSEPIKSFLKPDAISFYYLENHMGSLGYYNDGISLKAELNLKIEAKDVQVNNTSIHLSDNQGIQRVISLQSTGDNKSHHCFLYSGSNSDDIGVGLWDAKNSTNIWRYLDNTKVFEVNRPTTINSTLTCAANLIMNNGIELYHATPYIDFHYANSTEDYTARIISTSTSMLRIQHSSLWVEYTLSAGWMALRSKYIGFYATNTDAANATNRHGWIGFGTGTTKWMTIKNECCDGTNAAGIEINLFKNNAYLRWDYTTANNYLNYRTTCSVHWFDKTINVAGLTNRSTLETKANIIEYEQLFKSRSENETCNNTMLSALNIVQNSKIYQYDLKTEIYEGTNLNKHYGFVIGKEGTPQQLLSYNPVTKKPEAIDLYSMSSISWQAIKELSNSVYNQQKDQADMIQQLKEMKNEIIELRLKLSIFENASEITQS